MKSQEQRLQELREALTSLPELVATDTLIHTCFQSQVPELETTSSYLYNLGGKRIRPSLTILVAYCFSKARDTQKLINSATAIELIHTASLLHDDIIDNARIRRHEQSANTKFGLANALLAGNFLYTRAFALLATIESADLAKVEKACIALTEGEALESNLALKEFSLNQALKIAKLKTASLFGLACYLGISSSKSNAKLSTALALYGENLGLVFQIIDDILDLTPNNHCKTQGQDLLEKKPSILNVLWLNSGSLLAQEFLLGSQHSTTDCTTKQFQQALDELQHSNIKQEALKIAKEYQNEALQYLAQAKEEAEFFEPKYFDFLQKIAELSTARIE